MTASDNNSQLGDIYLLEWGRFVRKRTDNGLGYPKVSPSFKDAIKGHGSAPLVSDKVFLVDRVMARFRQDDRDVYLAAYWWYAKSVPVSICAVRLKCTERTVRNRILKARLAVAKAVKSGMGSIK